MTAMARRLAYCGSGDGGGGVDTTIASTRQGQGADGTRPAQVRQGQCNDGIMTDVTRERETARWGCSLMINAGRAKEVRRWHST